MYETDSLRWRALQNRDSAASSYFVYAVISTKIYCRPGCPSRLARRANVCFYNKTDEARAAGYRPCLRCKPDQAETDPDGHGAQREAVERACRYIQRTKGQAKFADVAKHVGLSTRYLYGIFKAIMGTTPAKYADGLGLRQKSGLEEAFSSRSWSTDLCLDSGSGSGAGSGVASVMMDETFESNMDMIAWDSLLDLDWVDFSAVDTASGSPWRDSGQHDTSSVSLSGPSEPVIADAELYSGFFEHFDPFLPIVSSQNTDSSHPSD